MREIKTTEVGSAPMSIWVSLYKLLYYNDLWRRGDSNPNLLETKDLQEHDNSATEHSEKPLEGSSEKQNHDTSEQFQTLPQHHLGANMVRGGGSDADLEEIVLTWPRLPEHIKAAVKALIQSHLQGVQK